MSLLKTKNIDYLFTPDNIEKFSPVNGSLEVDILTKFVPIPSASSYNTYDGSVKNVTLNKNADLINMSGTTSATNAGEYTVVFALKDPINYRWSDNTNEPKEVKWKINKIKSTIPYNSRYSTGCNFTYDGNEHTPLFDNYESSKVNLTGDTISRDVGVHIVTASLKDDINYQWEDGTTDPINIAWSIEAIDFKLDADNRAKVGYTGAENEELVIPETFTDPDDGLVYKVVSIEDGAFRSCTNLKSVVIPYTVKKIGQSAFAACSNLNNVLFNTDILASIGQRAFYNCTALTSLVLPEGIESLGRNTFQNCSSLISVTMPKIAVSATGVFAGCGAVEKLYFAGTQEQWTNLLGTTLSSDTISKEFNYKYQTSNADKYLVVDDNGTIIFTKEKSNLKVLRIPSEVNGITVKSIGRYALGTTYLTKLTISNTIEVIEPYALTGNSYLEDIKFGNNLKIIKDNAFYNSTAFLKLEFPDGLEYLGKYNFEYLSNVTEIIFPGSLEKIDDIFECTKLTSLVFRDGIKEISAFRECTNLLSVEFPNSVISVSGFNNCTALTSVKFGDNIEKIQGFSNCTNLTEIILPDNLDKIYYTFNAFTNTPWLNNYSNITSRLYILGNSILSVDRTNYEIKDFIIPDGIKYLDQFMFNNVGIKTIYIPASVTEMSARTFNTITILEKVTFADNIKLEKLEEALFRNCKALKTINIPESVRTIVNGAFCFCTGLTEINIPEGVEEIDVQAFVGCTNLKTVYIPSSIKKISDSAFSNCTSLENIIYNGTKEEWYEINIGNNKEITNKKLFFNK